MNKCNSYAQLLKQAAGLLSKPYAVCVEKIQWLYLKRDVEARVGLNANNYFDR